MLHENLACSPVAVLEAVAPYRDGLVVAAECMFAWCWVADLCAAEKISFILGHALYMKAVHGGKTKNDKIDSHKIATLLRGGTFAQAYQPSFLAMPLADGSSAKPLPAARGVGLKIAM